MAERKNSEAGPSRSHGIPPPSFPTHNSPRTWFLTQGLSPLAVRLIRLLLAHGDYVVACLPPRELADEERSAEFRELASECRTPTGRFKDREGWKDRIRGIRCDTRLMGQCAAAVAEAVQVFGHIDIVLCNYSEAVVGTVEELSATRVDNDNAAVRDQFEAVFFAQVNTIKAVLPQLRAQHTGHIVALSSVSGHIGMPGMAMHTAAAWAFEGYCDSLAYEIAPFNIKVTVVQPPTEAPLLTNKIIVVPAGPEPMALGVPASAGGGSGGGDLDDLPPPGIRDMLAPLLPLDAGHITSPTAYYPKLPSQAVDRLVLETVHALTAIGGHENPPMRHIVGFEATAAVQDKFKTVTEELEDFVEAGLAVDIFDSELKREVRRRVAPATTGD